MDVDVRLPQHAGRAARNAVEQLAFNPQYRLSLDLFYQICGYLDPQDLLHLSRTSQALRYNLRSRTSRALWTRCLNTWPGLPDCTTWLNGPRYAWLAFENTCEICGQDASDGMIPGLPFWTLSVRYCQACRRSKSNVTGLVVITGKQVPRAEHVALSDVVRTTPHFDPPWLSWSIFGYRSTLPKLIQDFLNDWSAIREDNAEEYLEMRRQMIKEVKQHASLCHDFTSRKLNKSYEEALTTVLEIRTREIRGRLYKSYNMDYDWSTVYDVMSWDEKYGHIAGGSSLSNHPHVKIPKQLTDSEWDIIKDEIVKHIIKVLSPIHNEHRQDILWERRRIAHDAFVRSLDPFWDMNIPVTASVADIIDFPSFKEVIERPTHEDVTPNMFTNGSSYRGSTSAFIDDHHKWLDEVELKLYWQVGLFDPYAEDRRDDVKELWPDAPPPELDGEDAENTFWLATSIFRCTGSECRSGETSLRRRVAERHDDALIFPFVMDHVCLRGRLLPPPEGERHPIPVRWKPDCMTLHRPLHTVIAGIVRACGLDPAKATHDDMDCRNARLVCGLCFARLPFHKLAARSWWRSVLHYIDAHKNKDAPESMTWIRLSQRAERLARKIAPSRRDYFRQSVYECHYLTFCTACPLNELYDRRTIHHKRMKRHWKRHHENVMLDEGQRMWETAWVLRPKEPAPVRLKTIHKRLGITQYEDFFTRNNDNAGDLKEFSDDDDSDMYIMQD